MGNNKNKGFFFRADPAMQQAMRAITLPTRIKCVRCQKFANTARFSNKQLDEIRWAIKERGPNASYRAVCQMCSGAPIVELECHSCRKTKGIEAFSKAQRKKLDAAECYSCVDAQLEQTLIEEDQYEDPLGAFVPPDSSADRYPEYWGPSSSAASSVASQAGGIKNDTQEGGVSIAAQFFGLGNEQTLIGSEYSSHRDLNNETPKNAHKTTSWHTGPASSSSVSGLDPNKYGKPSIAASTTGSLSGARSFNSSVAERSEVTMSKKGGFAKIKAYVPEKKAYQPADWDSESEEDDDDDDDDDEDGNYSQI